MFFLRIQGVRNLWAELNYTARELDALHPQMSEEAVSHANFLLQGLRETSVDWGEGPPLTYSQLEADKKHFER